ncbi:4Fe-4S dicluster domain-containing protein [Chloroflexota bacterium]
MQIGFYFDQTRCTGCFTCTVACKDWHDVPAGPASWVRVTATEKGEFPDVSLSYLFSSCLHCAEPICVDACPMRALDAGPLDELKAEYGDAQTAEGFVYSKKVIPSIVFKPKLHGAHIASSKSGKK